MATKTQNPKPSPQNDAAPARGRPPADPNADPKQTATQGLQDAANRVCLGLVDRKTGTVLAHAARCARAGVSRDTAMKAVAGIQAALDDMVAGIERAYEAPTARPVVAQRVNLLD